MTTRNKTIGSIVAIILMLAALAGCYDQGSTGKDEKTAEEQLERFQRAQPVPTFDYSQQRENLIDINTAQAETTETTSFFFLEGVGLVNQCPSIGFPIASTAQLTNPEQKVNRHDLALPQIEPNGVYTGQSTGTYTVCIDGDGNAYGVYWEGYVYTTTGPAEFENDRITLTGSPTANFSEGE